MAGFPGETEKHFSSTLSFLEDLDFTYLHVFPYSIRPGTPAADFPDQIAGDVKETRVRSLRKLSDLKKERYYRKFIGSTRPVLVESKRDRSGLLKGFTDNYIPVFFQGEDVIQNSIVHVQLESADATKIYGRIVNEAL